MAIPEINEVLHHRAIISDHVVRDHRRMMPLYKGPTLTNDTLLTKEIAERWLEISEPRSGFTAIEDAAAEILSRHHNDLWLGFVTSISDATAQSLAKHRGSLYLSSLTILSDVAAEFLGTHKGDLCLSGLGSLSDAAAERLGKHQGDLILSGVTTVSDAAAESLSRHKGWLFMQGLTELSDEAVWSLSKTQIVLNDAMNDRFSDFLNHQLESDGKLTVEIAERWIWRPTSWFDTIEEAAAEVLSRGQGALHLDHLMSLPDSVAKHLAHRCGSLSLVGLTELSDVAAESFASHHRGGLSLWGLNTLTDAAAESLSRYPDDLFLEGLSELSENAIWSLSRRKRKCELSWKMEERFFESLERKFPSDGTLTLEFAERWDWVRESHRFTKIETDAAEHLSKHVGYVVLDGLTTLSTDIAECFATHQPGCLSLCGLTSLSDAAAESLGRLQGCLHLAGLTELSDNAAELLAGHQEALTLSGLMNISDAAAENLSKHQGSLYLNGVTKLSEAAAKSLSRHRGSLELAEQAELAVQRYRGLDDR